MLIKWFIASIALLLININILAQGYVAIGARSNALVNASATLNDVWAFHHNPGALGEIKETSVGISYENRFLIKDLQSQGFAFAQPLKVGVISVGGQFFGNRNYRSQRVGVGYSMKLTPKLFAGVQLNYQGLQLGENYGNKNTLTGEAGIVAYITDKWKFGASVTNVSRTKLADYVNERFQTTMRIGTSYNLSNKVLFLAEVQKSIDYQFRGLFAIEYTPIEQLFIRGGVGINPTEFGLGIGYRFKFIHLDVGSNFHPVLGWSPHVGLTYVAKKK